MSIDEPVAIVDYDATWPQKYEKERCAISAALGDLAIGIEHIGSTAVPGMQAKPIIDIQTGVASLQQNEKKLRELERLGYEALGEAGVPARLYFRKRQPSAFNLHVVIWRGELWNKNIVLRDYLRTHLDEAHRYREAKRDAITQGATTLLRYSELKNSFVTELLERANRWDKSPKE